MYEGGWQGQGQEHEGAAMAAVLGAEVGKAAGSGWPGTLERVLGRGLGVEPRTLRGSSRARPRYGP